MAEQPHNTWQIWMMAARPKTLPAAAAPVVVGTALALWDGMFKAGPAAAALLGALLLQAGSNLANDLFDYQRGADAGERLGPQRVTQSGLLSTEEVRTGMWLTFAAAALCGAYLAYASGPVVLLLGAASILAALGYSGGPLPFGYHGLGDLFVFLFFGVIAVNGTYFVQAGRFTAAALASSIPMGLLIDNILVVNNLRDIPLDRAAGKKTLAVLVGARATRVQYMINLTLSYLLPLLLWLVDLLPAGANLALLTLPLGIRLNRDLHRKSGRALNETLAGTGQLALLYALLFAVGGSLF